MALGSSAAWVEGSNIGHAHAPTVGTKGFGYQDVIQHAMALHDCFAGFAVTSNLSDPNPISSNSLRRPRPAIPTKIQTFDPPLKGARATVDVTLPGGRSAALRTLLKARNRTLSETWTAT